MSPSELTDTLMAFDRNGDGRLERGEVPERFQGLFARADADADGVLTRDELQRSATASVQEGAARRGGPPDPLFRALDADRDGALSSAELAAASAALASLDADHDGQLTGEEFRPPFRGFGRPEGGRR
jgi:Ca2+-binding EF-hand superfamily protein